MIVVYSNDTWTLLIANDDTTCAGTGNAVRAAVRTHRWIAESTAPAPCSPPDYHQSNAQWNAEKKRRELAGIKAAQLKHERIKHSACKNTRKVLKYYREPRFNAVNVKMEVEK
jgi:hypothetical protein